MNIPKGPEIKLPKFSRKGKDKETGEAVAKAAAPAARKRPSVEMPPFANDLYRDLRDRKLLIPAIALLAALLAVPFLLKADEGSGPVPPAAALPADAVAVEPAVLTEELGGVRDYRKRLDALKQKNPFKQQYLSAPGSGSAAEEISSASVESVGGSSTGSSSTGDASVSSPSVTGGSTPSVDTGTTPDTGSGDSNGDSKPDTVFYSYRVDVVIAHDGKRKKYDSVRPGQLLPDRSTPIAMYLGSPNSLDSARFLLSADVTSSEGDGHCAPHPNDCEFLKMSPGDKRALTYGPQDAKYSILLKDIRRVIIHNPEKK